MKMKKLYMSWGILLVSVVLINVLAHFFFVRYDATSNKRYSLSQETKELVEQVEKPVQITVFLEGDFPLSFRKIQTETLQLLEEYSALNSRVQVSVENLLDEESSSGSKYIEQLIAKGVRPTDITVLDKGKKTRVTIFPWAMVQYNGKEALVPLVKSTRMMSSDETVKNSIQNLEYEFSNAIRKVIQEKSKKIAVIKGVGEYSDLKIADLLLNLREEYFIAPFTLDFEEVGAKESLQALKKFDAILVNHPSKPFSDDQLQVIDQYVMSGGSAVFAVEEVMANQDSLQTKGEFLAYPNLTNLQSLLFKYGVRVNPKLVKDEMGTLLRVAIGKQGTQTQYEDFIWKFAPYALPTSDHPIVKNIEGVRFDFANPIDTLPNNIKKTILLHSSPSSSLVGVPTIVSLSMLNEEVNLGMYERPGLFPLAVLLEGSFTSMYKNRVLPFEQADFVEQGKETKIIVIGDGDVATNQLDAQMQPLEMGFDKWTNQSYGNKEFIMNSFDYLLGNTKLFELRAKELVLPLLDREKVYKDYYKIQLYVLVSPLIFLLLFGLIFTNQRKKRYGTKKK